MGLLGPMAEFVHVRSHLVITAFQAASGVLNLFTPTSGVVMGGLGAAKVELKTYMKWGMKLFVAIAIANIVVLSLAMMLIK